MNPRSSSQPSVDSVPRYQPIHEAVSQLDLDILEELEQFRSWQQHYAPSDLSQSLNPSPISELQGDVVWSDPSLLDPTPAPTAHPDRRPALQPQDVLEDLDIEVSNRPAWLSPVAILILWIGSCSTLAMGLWWLISPGDPNRQIAIQPQLVKPTPIPTPTLKKIDLDTLPFITLTSNPFSRPLTDIYEYQADQTLDPSTLTAQSTPAPQPTISTPVEPLHAQKNVLDSLQTDTSTVQALPQLTDATPPSDPNLATVNPELAPAPLATPDVASTLLTQPVAQPRTVTVQAVEPADPSRGEGTFIVLVSYQDEATLTKAKQVASGAFVKEISGQKYVQVASFKQLEYARFMVDQLQKEGLAAVISQP